MNRLIILITAIGFCFASEKLKIEIYELNNGLTVMLNEDKNASSIFGAVVVKGGGKQDPADATGIAHYLDICYSREQPAWYCRLSI